MLNFISIRVVTFSFHIQTTRSHASWCHHSHYCSVDIVLFHNVTCYANLLVSRIHVSTTNLLHSMCTLVATCMILGRLECTYKGWLEIVTSFVPRSLISLTCLNDVATRPPIDAVWQTPDASATKLSFEYHCHLREVGRVMFRSTFQGEGEDVDCYVVLGGSLFSTKLTPKGLGSETSNRSSEVNLRCINNEHVECMFLLHPRQYVLENEIQSGASKWLVKLEMRLSEK